MGEILKEYHLYEDLSRINNSEYFQDTFDTPDLTALLASITDADEYQFHYNSLRVYFGNMMHVAGKSVYVVLKWLIVAHRLLPVLRFDRLLTAMQNSLCRVKEPIMETLQERYFWKRVGRPYQVYLQKLACLRAEELNSTDQDTLWFMKYSIVQMGLGEILDRAVEFRGFLRQEYPFLGKVYTLLEQQIAALLSELRQSHQKKQLISEHDLTQLEKKMAVLAQPGSPISEFHLLTVEDLYPVSCEGFFDSAAKTSPLYSSFF